MEIVNSVVIHRPIEEVFDVATCLRRAIVWRGPIVETSKVTPGEVGVGTAYEWKIHQLGIDLEANPVITVWEPPFRSEFEDKSAAVPFQGRQTFESTPDGTRVTFRIEAEPQGAFGHLAESLLQRLIERQERSNLATLKEMMESETPIETD